MIIDFFSVLLVTLACIKGYRKGFIVAIFSVVAIIIGLAAALKLSSLVAIKLKESLSTTAYQWLPFISFAIVFIGAVLLVRIGAKLIEKSVEMVMLGWINRLAGIFLYILLYLMVWSVFLFYAEKFDLFKTDTIKASMTYNYIQPLGPAVMNAFGKIIPFFKDMFTDLEEFFGKISDKKTAVLRVCDLKLWIRL